MKFTFGSDPEFMLMRGTKYYSATGIVGGTKDRRIAHGGNEYYYDNVMAEVTSTLGQRCCTTASSKPSPSVCLTCFWDCH